MPWLYLGALFSYLDRGNLSYAALQLNSDLGTVDRRLLITVMNCLVASCLSAPILRTAQPSLTQASRQPPMEWGPASSFSHVRRSL